MGIFARLFGAVKNNISGSAFGSDNKLRAAANQKRVAQVLAMADAGELKSFCAAETEICTALLGLSRLLQEESSGDSATLASFWKELVAMDAPVFAKQGTVRFDPEMFLVVREQLSDDLLVGAISRLGNRHLADYAVSTGDYDDTIAEWFYEISGDRAVLKEKLFSRMENEDSGSRSPHIVPFLWFLIEQADDQRALSVDLVRYARVVGDRDRWDAESVVGKLVEPARARCTGSWFQQETAPELWGAMIRQSASVDTAESIISSSAPYIERILMDLKFQPGPWQTEADFGDLTNRKPDPAMSALIGRPDPVLPSDRSWYEALQPLPEMNTSDKHFVLVAAKGLIYYLSRNWEECRDGLTWANLPTDLEFTILLLCLERENPQVRLNAVLVLIELARVGLFDPADPGSLNRDDRYETATPDRAADALAKLARGGNEHVRRAALYAARYFRQPVLAEPVSAALSWPDSFGSASASRIVAEWIAAGRIEFHDEGTLQRLPGALANWQGGPHAADALDALGWQPANDLERIRYAGARRSREALETDRAMTDAVLMHDVQRKTYAPVENAVWLFIGLGDPEIIPQLIATLNDSGTKVMAEAYLNCGHADLHAAASDWARRHGYSIESGFGANPVGWGGL